MSLNYVHRLLKKPSRPTEEPSLPSLTKTSFRRRSESNLSSDVCQELGRKGWILVPLPAESVCCPVGGGKPLQPHPFVNT